MLSYEQALEFLLQRARPVEETEEVPLREGLGRVLARGVASRIDVPPWDNSAMDGYAVAARDVPGDGEVRLPVTQRIAAGAPGEPLAPGTAARIFTGAPMPPGADAVVVQEDCEESDGTVRFSGPVGAGENVRPRGNDIGAGTAVLPAGVRLRPQELGLAASVGVARLPVFRRLRVAILATGDELVEPGQSPGPGQIYNSNRYTLLGLLSGLGCEVLDLGIVPDDAGATLDTLAAAAASADLVLTSGGVSVGEEDHVKRAVESLGHLDLWQVRVKPGKPLAYGRIGAADVLGVPGNPVSALVTFMLFARPFLLRRQCVERVWPVRFQVEAGFAWPRPGTRREFLRARLEAGPGGRARAMIFPRQGSDVLTSAVWAEGLVDLREGATVQPGAVVDYLPFSEVLG
jgi:molybdopterin molybdotransferase